MNEDCNTTGGHYNPTTETHGDVDDHHHCHIGDLGNIVADENKIANQTIVSHTLKLFFIFSLNDFVYLKTIRKEFCHRKEYSHSRKRR